MEIKDKSSVIFGNQIDQKTIKKGIKNKAKFIKEFGDDTNKEYHLGLEPIPTLDFLGAQNLVLSDKPLELPKKAVVVGNIRMGFGHYRISIALASCAKSLGYEPIWMDLASFDATGSKMIRKQNDMHIHDNDCHFDRHGLPFSESIDFDLILDSLARIDYQGDITFECDGFINRMPKELHRSCLRLMFETGLYLRDELLIRRKAICLEK